MRAKRLFDLCATIAGLLLLWPVLLIVALLIKLDDGGSVFFRQERVGRAGRAFRVWKFRTMVPDAETARRSAHGGRRPAHDARGPLAAGLQSRRVTATVQRPRRRDEPRGPAPGGAALRRALLGRPTSRPGSGAGHHGSGEHRVQP